MFSRVLFAELFKAWCRFPLLFWGFLFIPIFSFAADLVLLSHPFRLPNAAPRVDLLFLLSHAMEISASPLAQVFFVAAAAVIFGTEYDSETWRLVATRARRVHWILAKVLLYAIGVFCSLTLVALGTTFCAILDSINRFVPLVWEAHGGSAFAAFAAVFGISWLELLLLGSVTGLVAVATRSVLVSAVTVILIAFSQWILVLLVPLTTVARGGASSTAILTSLPGLAANVGRFFITHAEVSPGLYIPAREAGIAVASLWGWIALTLALTLIWFHRQELSRE